MLVECDPGFFGENCFSTCPPGNFGLKCREPCNCSPDKYCDPIRGCVCNTTSVNCTDPEHESTQEMTINPTTMQPVERILLAVPFLLPVIACLIFGTICIRIRYSQMMKKKKDLFSMQNKVDFTVRNHPPETEEQNPNDEIYDHVNLRVHHSNHSIYNTGDTAVFRDSALSFVLTTTVPLQQSQSVESIQNKWRLHDDRFGESTLDEAYLNTVDNKTTDRQADIYSTPCKSMTKKQISCFSEQGQQRNGNETVTFESPNSIIDAIVHEPESQTKLISSLKWTQEEEIYANDEVVPYANNSIKLNSPLESYDSGEYFDVSYEGQLKA
uniref:Uncharacterized protein n=1 Tax=Magallana gigas TaxID=29159 RepID=A0A8W8KMV4_MAGGI